MYLNMEGEVSELRNQALQKIGRNVLNFQRMETALKSLIVASNLQGNPSDLAEIHRKNSEWVEKRSMGVLVNEFFSTVYANDRPEEATPPPNSGSSETWVSFAFRAKYDEKRITALREALLRVVHERNELIHQMLGAFDSSSDESCRDLISRLDEQNERLRPYYDCVMQMHERLRSLKQEVLANWEEILRSTGTDSGDGVTPES